MAQVVTLLGGESTGKTALAQALHASLNAQGLHTALSPEYLRQWCEHHGRAPLAHEQAAIADEQGRQTEALARNPDLHLVIADTSPLVIAAYSELYFNDRALWAPALDWQRRRVDLSLLMGLDLPWVSDGFFRDSPAVREATDALLRRELQAAGIAFQTIHGHGAARAQQALRAIARTCSLPIHLPETTHAPRRQNAWHCEHCSDPECEHRLFSPLLSTSSRSTAHPT